MINKERLIKFAIEKTKDFSELEPEEFASARQESLAKLSKLSFGDKKDPFWKYSKIFKSSEVIQEEKFEKHIHETPEGILYGRTTSLLDTYKEFFEKHLSKNEHFSESFFATLTAAASQGYAIVITKAFKEKKIELSFHNSIDRLFVIIEDGVEIEVSEAHVHKGLSANVIEYMIGENARVKLTSKEQGDVVIASRFFTLKANSFLQTHTEHLKGQIIRNENTMRLIGKYAEVVVMGVNRLVNDLQSDTRIVIHHDVPNTRSKTAYRYLADDTSTGIFGGMIVIAKGADKTEADMTTKAILESDTARMYGEPQLEIYTDDVICTHGASTGTVNKDALFYLQSRGLSEKNAKKELTESFLNEPLLF